MGGRSYTEYAMAPSGRYLQQHGGKCMLPVPASVREAEQEAKRKLREAMLKLQAAGVDISSLPPEEQRLGKGEVIDAYTHFHAAVEHALSYCPAKAEAMLQLKERISTWRLEVAAKQRMAPAAVLAEHLVVKIAYAASRGPLSSDALKAVGVRAAPVQELEALGFGRVQVNATTGDVMRYHVMSCQRLKCTLISHRYAVAVLFAGPLASFLPLCVVSISQDQCFDFYSSAWHYV